MRAHHFLLPILLVAACGTTGDAPEGPLSPAPPDGGQQLATTTYHLAPGEETYWCYQFYSPDDAVAITKVTSISSPGVHHFALFQAFGKNEPDAPHECKELVKTTWQPIWASGTGSKDMTLPDGTGFVIQPHTQYVIQLHLQNASDAPIDVRAGVDLSYSHTPDALIPAGIYALGTFSLDIPANTLDYQVPLDCAPGKDMNVFTIFPHMHKIGTKLEVTRTPAGQTQPAMFYKIDPWPFGDQPMDQVSEKLAPGDQLHVTCHYDNRTGSDVTYGESSDDEMCFFVMFYYPFTGLDGCLSG